MSPAEPPVLLGRRRRRSLRPIGVSCPSCQSTEVRPSHQFRLVDTWQWILGRHAFRCYACMMRFYAH